MESTVKQRLMEFIDYKEISIREFERTCGLSYGYINNIRVSIQPDKLSNIARCYPEISKGWMLPGRAPMLKEGAVKPDEVIESSSDREERLLCIIESQQRTIEKLTEMATKKRRLHTWLQRLQVQDEYGKVCFNL